MSLAYLKETVNTNVVNVPDLCCLFSLVKCVDLLSRIAPLQNRVYLSYCILVKVILFDKHLLKTGEPKTICFNALRHLTVQKKYGRISGSPLDYLVALWLFETSEVNKL